MVTQGREYVNIIIRKIIDNDSPTLFPNIENVAPIVKIMRNTKEVTSHKYPLCLE